MAEQQRLTKIHFEQLKGLKNVTFDLGEKNVTGIFGPNGCGKSTILHVLLCLYKPKTDRTNYRYSNFFISVDDNNWRNSKFTYEGSYSEQGVSKTFSRTIHKKRNRWIHDYGERPDRDVYYIGINSSVPDVEVEKSEFIHLIPQAEAVNKSNEIIRIASDVMNFQYSKFEYRESNSHKNYISCKNGNIDYISLSMGAGEQRLFRILTLLVTAPKYSLIVIDEIDLTLHSRALNKLITHIVRLADENKLQVVFTSHRQEIVTRTDINIRHIIPSINGADTLCLEQTTTDCVERLSGTSVRPIEVFVEDDVAKSIVEHIASELKIKSKVSICTFGDAANAFRVIAGLQLASKLTDNIVAITDGDVYRTNDDRVEMMKRSISGNEAGKDELRRNLLCQVLQFKLPDDKNPDEYIHDILCSSNKDNEIITIAKSVIGVYDKHQYLNDMIDKLGGSREVELERIVEEVSQTESWSEYTMPIREWLKSRKVVLGIE